MIRVTQSRVGERGTCFRACLASILDLPERAVVDFDGPRRYKHGQRGLDDYWANVEGWLAERGLRYRRVPIDGARPVGWSTVEGISPRGGLHACVAYDGELVHDPHPQDGTGRGLVEPRWYGLLEPIKGNGRDSFGGRVKNNVTASSKVKTALNRSAESVEVRELRSDIAARKRVLASGKLSSGDVEYAKRRLVEQERKLSELLSRATDRADMPALRRNTERQGGPFFVQETTKGGAERVLPVRELSKAADASPARVALLLAALLAWYRARKAECGKKDYDLTRYAPKRRAFDESVREQRRGKDALLSSQLNRYPMSRLLDALGIDIREYMRRDEAQKERLLRAAIEKLDVGAR